MHLLIRRSQRNDGWLWDSILFVLDARLALDAEEEDLFHKYNLGPTVVYDSDAYSQHSDATYQHFNEATKVPIWNPSWTEIANSLWNNLAGLGHSAMKALSLRITLGDLVAGTHIECEDLQPILIAENQIKQAVHYLADYLQTALTFDGRDDLHEI